jgi:hypothetical protein
MVVGASASEATLVTSVPQNPVATLATFCFPADDVPRKHPKPGATRGTEAHSLRAVGSREICHNTGNHMSVAAPQVMASPQPEV